MLTTDQIIGAMQRKAAEMRYRADCLSKEAQWSGRPTKRDRERIRNLRAKADTIETRAYYLDLA